MGDRGNIAIKQSSGQVWLYSHWGGYELPEVLRLTLARKERWTDESYLARIVISGALKDSIDDATGYGVSTCLQDNQYDILVCDIPAQTVYTIPEKLLTEAQQVPDGYVAEAPMSFEQFAALPEASWQTFKEHVAA